jgi:hypothetical protein
MVIWTVFGEYGNADANGVGLLYIRNLNEIRMEIFTAIFSRTICLPSRRNGTVTEDSKLRVVCPCTCGGLPSVSGEGKSLSHIS